MTVDFNGCQSYDFFTEEFFRVINFICNVTDLSRMECSTLLQIILMALLVCVCL